MNRMRYQAKENSTQSKVKKSKVISTNTSTTA